MNKAIRIVLIGIPALVALLLVIGFVVVHTDAFRHFLLTKIIQQAEQSTGARIEIQQLAIHWVPFNADFYGVVVHGQEGSCEPPLIVADHLGVGLGLRALLQHEVDLYSITFDHPIVNMRVDAKGNNNLPKAPPSQSSTNMQLQVRHVALQDGILNYNDQQIPLSADLEDVSAQSDYDTASSTYKGFLGYGKGRILTRGMNPIDHNVRVEFTANRDGIVLDPMVLYSGHNRLTARAKVTDFANPKVEGTYDGILVTPEIAQILKNPTLPRGDITFSGIIGYQSSPNQPLVQALKIQGRLDSAALAVRMNQISTAIRSIHGAYRLEDGNLRVQKLDADILDGHLSAQAEMLHLAQNPSSRVNATVRGLSLAKVSDSLPSQARQNARLIGKANLNAEASWSNNIQAMNAHSHLEITGPNQLNARPNEIPVNGVIDVAYDGAKQAASFGRSQLHIASTEIILSGVVSRNSSLNVEANANDLHELTVLAAAFSAPAPMDQPASSKNYDLRGTAHFAGQITGPTSDPQIKGQLTGSNIEVQGSKWRIVRLNFDAASSGVQFQNGCLKNSQQGQISFSGRIGLDHWSFKPESPLSLQAKLTKLAVGDLERLAKLEYPISGDLSGDIAVEGSQLHPLGHGSLQLVKASAWNEPIKSLKMDFQGDEDSVQTTANLQVAAGAVDTTLTYVPKTQHYNLNLKAPNLKLDQLQSIQARAGSINGVLTINVTGQGTVKDPQLSGKLEIPQLQVSGQTFSGVKAQLDLAHQHGQVDLESIVEQGYVRVKGGVDLTGQYQTDATIDVRALPIGPLLAKHSTTTGTAQDLRGTTEIHGFLKGPLKDPARMEGRVEIPRLDFAYKTIQLANEGPFRITYRNGIATIEQARIKGTGTDLSMKGVVPVRSAVPLNVTAQGAM